MSNELLAGYETVKASGGTGKKTPIVEIKKCAVGAYLKGVLLKTKVFEDGNDRDDKGQPKKKVISTFRLVETTCPLLVKGAAGYAPAPEGSVKVGDEVTVYDAPARLAKALLAIEDGGKNEVLIVSEGKKKEKLPNGKTVSPFTFKVGKRSVSLNTSADESGVPD